jgi:hypothetical protein
MLEELCVSGSQDEHIYVAAGQATERQDWVGNLSSITAKEVLNSNFVLKTR